MKSDMSAKIPQKILILAPHTDDAEFGCGGSIARFIEEGKEVYCTAFSACKQSLQKDLPEDILIQEVGKASEVLGVKKDRLLLYDYEVRTFNYHRQEILDDLIKLRSSIKPDLVIMPSLNDIHQDHRTIAEEGLRAFKFSSIWCYEMPWNNLNFQTTAFVKLDERHVAKKVKAIEQYVSQRQRNYANEEFIRSLARTRGVQINQDYAEVFEVLRWVV
jgi:LmbE family N-acetylglucosaminyl deacetylase